MPLPSRARCAAELVRRATLAFLFPNSCLACGRALDQLERHLCCVCRGALRAEPGTAPAPAGSVIEGVPFALTFHGPARALLRALKYDSRLSIATELAELVLPLARAAAGRGMDVLVPVPLHRARGRERGFNQSALLARSLASDLGVPALEALTRTRATRSQTGLSRTERLRNVAGAFRGTGTLAGARVLVLDDVVTTGATIAAACAAALEAGAASVEALAVAGPGNDDGPRPETG